MPSFTDYVLKGMSSLRFPGRYGNGQIPWGSMVARLPGATYDYKKEAGDLWMNNVVSSAIKWQMRTYPEARQCIYRPGKKGQMEALYEHTGLDLLKRPNAYYPRSVLEAGMLLSLAVDGNAYLYKLRSDHGKIVGLLYIPHFMIEPMWDNAGFEFTTGYLYKVDGKFYVLPSENVIHLRDGIDPRNPRKGLAPLASLLREICSENEASTFTAAIMRNMGVPGVVLSPKLLGSGGMVSINVDTDSIKETWMDKFRGESRGEPFVNNIPMDVTKVSFSPEELALSETRGINAGRICAGLGLDPMVLGIPSEQKTYSNYTEAREAAYESNIIPLHRIVDEQFTLALMDEMLFSQPGDEFGRDYTNVRVLQEDVNELHKRAREDYKDGLIMRSVGLRMIGEPFTDADNVYYSPMAQNDLPEPDQDDDPKKVRAQLGQRWAERRKEIARAGR